ncbi:hypothetical protein [Bacillus sp. SD088]|nr:hypothetical protein [Bacillus sp. SD088]MBO0995667.1 hypothetical protein [Bacillus sp. SD088]
MYTTQLAFPIEMEEIACERQFVFPSIPTPEPQEGSRGVRYPDNSP